MHTKLSFIARAVSSSSNDSRSITWHQWHAAYPIESRIGRSSSRARASASAPHAYQSTGLSACWRRYGDVSSARRFTRLRYPRMGAALPSGTVTFVFTDVEGSTRLLQELGDDYATVHADQRRLIRESFAAHGGTEIDTQGDELFFSFARAREAVAAAVDAQRALRAHAWPRRKDVRVRMGLHTGEPTVGEEGYLGSDVVREALL